MALSAISEQWGSPDPAAREGLIRRVIGQTQGLSSVIAQLLRTCFEEIEWDLPTDDARFLTFFESLTRFELERRRRDQQLAEHQGRCLEDSQRCPEARRLMQ
jgi:hypothetical protein